MQRVTTAGPSADLSCPPDHPYALGGGGDDYYVGSGESGNAALIADEPDVNGGSYYPDGWYVATDPAPAGTAEILKVWVTCSK
jgi:hypothetical protein